MCRGTTYPAKKVHGVDALLRLPSIIVMHLQLLNKQERQASLCMVPSCLTFFPFTSETSAVAQLTSSRQSWTPGCRVQPEPDYPARNRNRTGIPVPVNWNWIGF